MVLPPSKRQKAQKPHHCAVFLLLKCFIFFKVQMLFCLRKIAVYFQNFFYARSNRLFRQSLSCRNAKVSAACLFYSAVSAGACSPSALRAARRAMISFIILR